MLAEIKQFFVI